MTFLGFIELIKIIGGIASALMALFGLFGFISKKPRNWLSKVIREESKAANHELEIQVKELVDETEKNHERALVSFRHSITGIYEKYKVEKKLPPHMKADLFSLYEQYIELGGNSYVKQIVSEMKDWD